MNFKVLLPLAIALLCIPALVMADEHKDHDGKRHFDDNKKHCTYEKYECGSYYKNEYVPKKCYYYYCPSGHRYHENDHSWYGKEKCYKKEYECGYYEYKQYPKYCYRHKCYYNNDDDKKF
jgi:hypothetical protein